MHDAIQAACIELAADDFRPQVTGDNVRGYAAITSKLLAVIAEGPSWSRPASGSFRRVFFIIVKK